MLLSRWESRAGHCNFWIFEPDFRKENIIILEARSILNAVRHAESVYPPGRLLTVGDSEDAARIHVTLPHLCDPR